MRPHRSLAEFLRAARERAELSQRDVSTRLGYSTPQFISNWERGVSSPPCKTLRSLAEMYRVSAEELYEILVAEAQERVKRELHAEFYGRAVPVETESKARPARRRSAVRARRA